MVYALGLVLIASVYIGFAASDGRPAVLAVDLHTHVAAGERWEAVSTISTMLVVAVFIAMVAVVGLLSWRWRDSPLAPRTCCSLRRWPPDDLTAQRPRL